MLISAALGLFVAKPRYEVMIDKKGQLSENQAKLTALKAKKDALLKLEKDQKRIEDASKKAKDLLPSGSKTSDFLVQVDATIMEVGGITKSIGFPAPKKETKTETESSATAKTTQTTTQTAKKQYQSTPFAISLTSDYKQLIAIIDIMENLSRLNLINSFSLTSNKDNMIEIKFEGNIFYK